MCKAGNCRHCAVLLEHAQEVPSAALRYVSLQRRNISVMPVLTCSLSGFFVNNAFCKQMLCGIEITVIQAYWTLKRNSFCLTCSISIYAYNNGSAGMVCVSEDTNLYHSQCSHHVACDVVSVVISFVGVLKIVCTLRCWLTQIYACIRQVPEMRL